MSSNSKMKVKKKPIAKKSASLKDKEKVILLKEVVLLIAGFNSVEVVDTLYKKKNVNEFLIAKKLDLTINQARNILYKLADKGLVSFIRKKDKKAGGWYTYFWTLDVGKTMLYLEKHLSEEIINLEGQLKGKQTKRFYHCPICAVEMSEDNALMSDFTCQECGEVFEAKDSEAHIEEMERKISELNNKMLSLKEVIGELMKKAEIAKEKRLKKEAEKKKAERAARRKERTKLKEKEKLKEMKSKTVKKKVTKKKMTKKKTTKKKAAKKKMMKKKTTKKKVAKKKTLKGMVKSFKKIKKKTSKK